MEVIQSYCGGSINNEPQICSFIEHSYSANHPRLMDLVHFKVYFSKNDMEIIQTFYKRCIRNDLLPCSFLGAFEEKYNLISWSVP